MDILTEKLRGVAIAVLPITIIVLVLNITIAPVGTEAMLRFFIGSIYVILGLSIFLLGADIGIEPLGNLMGSTLTKKKSLGLLIGFGFLLGFFTNMAEPSLQVLANQVSMVTAGAISQGSLIIVVSVGIGLLLAVGLLRVVLAIPLHKLLTVLYGIVFLLTVFSSESILSIAFDSGGATTGSMTVPFILALGIGISSIRGGKRAEADSFGLVAVASVGPMLAVLTMSLLGNVDLLTGSTSVVTSVKAEGLLQPFVKEMTTALPGVAVSLLPLLVIFLLFQVISFKLKRKRFTRILKGLLYTYIGFVIFLTGVNAGFMEAGSVIGNQVAAAGKTVVIVTGFILGLAVILAEPAVHVLVDQIEDVTSGHIKRNVILFSLSVGVALAVSLSLARILLPQLRFWHLIVPGYLLALALSYFTPEIFVGIAFDSGGVASGPMTATFILAFARGVAEATPGADVLLDAFGIIAMVALIPLVSLQFLGILYETTANREKEGLS